MLQRADVRLGDAIRRAGSAPIDRTVTVTTDLGSLWAVLGMGGALAAGGRRAAAGDVLAAGAVAWMVSQGAKTRVRRERPYEAHGTRRLIRPPTGSSFPSGHAAVGAAAMTAVADRVPGRAGRAVLYGIAAYVPVSRVYVGVHYPTDVAGGAGMGLALSALWRAGLLSAGPWARRRCSRGGAQAPAGARPSPSGPPARRPRRRSSG